MTRINGIQTVEMDTLGARPAGVGRSDKKLIAQACARFFRSRGMPEHEGGFRATIAQDCAARQKGRKH